MAIRITFTGTPPSGRGAARIMKAAFDVALANHRRKFLPRHFTAAARSLYPSEYAASKRSRKSLERAAAIKRRFADMSDSERREYRRRMATQNKARSLDVARDGLRVIDRDNELPLVFTGRSRNAILNGATTLTGPAATRRMQFNPPFYFFINNRMPGGLLFNKVEAVQALRTEEEDEFVRSAQDIIDRDINR
jgi:hypothetical protein